MESQRGSVLLQYDGYTFNKKYKTRYGQRWVCSTHSTKGCKAYVSTDESNNVLDYDVIHSHVTGRTNQFYGVSIKYNNEIVKGNIENVFKERD